MFQFLKFDPPKQDVCACHVWYDPVKHNNKSNTGVQSVISVIVYGVKCAFE